MPMYSGPLSVSDEFDSVRTFDFFTCQSGRLLKPGSCYFRCYTGLPVCVDTCLIYLDITFLIKGSVSLPLLLTILIHQLFISKTRYILIDIAAIMTRCRSELCLYKYSCRCYLQLTPGSIHEAPQTFMNYSLQIT